MVALQAQPLATPSGAVQPSEPVNPRMSAWGDPSVFFGNEATFAQPQIEHQKVQVVHAGPH